MMSLDGAKGSTLFSVGDSERSGYCAQVGMIVNGMMQSGFLEMKAIPAASAQGGRDRRRNGPVF
jgi:hypothetical protein